MKIHKRMATIVACLSASAAIAAMSGCSIILMAIDGGGVSSSSDGSGTDSVVGTYTFDISVYDEDFLDNTGGASYIREIITGRGATQTNTLILGSDGTYQLTKDIAFSTEGDSWYCHYVYSYFGSYTNSGSTVTLGEVVTIAWESQAASVLENNNVATTHEYTETTDFTADADFIRDGATLIDFWYGPYVRNSGMGNVSQTVYIGDYEWGGFTFADDGLSGSTETDEPDDDGGEQDNNDENAADAILTLSGQNNPDDMTLYFYADGTYTFSNTLAVVMSESGTWEYDSDNETLKLIYSDGVSVAVEATADGEGNISFTYYYGSIGGGLNNPFSLTVNQLTAAIEAAETMGGST